MIQALNTNKSSDQSYSIANFEFGSYTAYKLSNKDTGESATIIPAAGGILNSLLLSKNNTIHEIIDGCVDEKELLSNGSAAYKSSILFPYPNRIKGGLYTYEGKMYQFDCNNNGNSLHGLCSNAGFHKVSEEAKKTKASLTIEYILDGKHAAYPFEMTLTVVYELSKTGLAIFTEIKNTGSKTAPVGLGWHPYFKTGSKVDALNMSFPPHYTLPNDDNQIPTGKKNAGFSFAGLEAIGSLFLDNGYMLDTELKQAIVKIQDPVQDFTIEIEMEKGYGFMQVYTPAHRNSIAIEPQTCAPDAFNNKLGLMELQPGEKRMFQYTIAIS